MNKTTALVQLVICFFIVLISFGLIIYIRLGFQLGENAPDIARYEKHNNSRIFGASPLASYQKVSQSDCLGICDKNPACLSVVYDKNNICKLYDTNDDIDKDIIDEAPLNTYYKKYAFWSRFTPAVNGEMIDFSGSGEWITSNNVKDCAIKCLKQKKDPTCRGFNYRTTNNLNCKLLTSSLKGNEKYIQSSDNTKYYGLLDTIISNENIIPITNK